MNRTLTSTDSVVSPHSQRAQFSIACILPGSTHAARSRCDISGQSTRFSTANTALRAVKETEEHDESHVDFTRHCGKSPVTTSAVLHCVYLAWKHPCRRIKVTFQVSRPAFPPRARPCERSKRLRSTMNRTLTSPDIVVSPHSQRAQFSIAFILPGSTYAAGSR